MATSANLEAAMANYANLEATQSTMATTQDATKDKGYEFFTTQKGGRGLSDSNYGFEYTFVMESKIVQKRDVRLLHTS